MVTVPLKAESPRESCREMREEKFEIESGPYVMQDLSLVAPRNIVEIGKVEEEVYLLEDVCPS